MRILILLLICSLAQGQEFRSYTLKSQYSAKLAEINAKYGYPSKDYSKILNGKRVFFKCDTVVTRTYANENPTRTENRKYIMPVLDYVREDFDSGKLVEYDKTWYPEPELELIK